MYGSSNSMWGNFYSRSSRLTVKIFLEEILKKKMHILEGIDTNCKLNLYYNETFI